MWITRFLETVTKDYEINYVNHIFLVREGLSIPQAVDKSSGAAAPKPSPGGSHCACGAYRNSPG
jgi:hypothetical protein